MLFSKFFKLYKCIRTFFLVSFTKLSQWKQHFLLVWLIFMWIPFAQFFCFLFSLIPVINILGKSIHLNEIAIHNSSDVAVENAKNMIHNLGHLKQDSKPRYSAVYDFSLLFLLIFIFWTFNFTNLLVSGNRILLRQYNNCQRVRPSGRPEGLTRRQIIEPRKDMCMGKKSHKRSKV